MLSGCRGNKKIKVMNSRVKRISSIGELREAKVRFEKNLNSRRRVHVSSRPYYREMISDIEERIIELKK